MLVMPKKSVSEKKSFNSPFNQVALVYLPKQCRFVLPMQAVAGILLGQECMRRTWRHARSSTWWTIRGLTTSAERAVGLMT